MKKTKSKTRAGVRHSVGRPRSEHSRAAILQVAYRLLEKQSVNEISALQIARKAGVSTATIYRWWKSKEELLLDSFLAVAGEYLTHEQEGNPLDQLRGFMQLQGRLLSGKNGIVAMRLLMAVQDNAKLHKEFLKLIFHPRDNAVREIVQTAIVAGELPDDLKITDFLDLLIGPLFARLLFHQESIDARFVDEVFDTVIVGARAVQIVRL